MMYILLKTYFFKNYIFQKKNFFFNLVLQQMNNDSRKERIKESFLIPHQNL